MKDDLISVIIPTFNRRDKLFRSIKSVLDQTYSNIELIIVDDGSTDGTKAEVNKIRDERIRYIYLKENHGSAGARNVGVKEAKGKFIAFQDSDDEWKENKLQMQIEAIKKDPAIGLVYCAMEQYDYSGKLVATIPDGQLPDHCKLGYIFEFMLTYALVSTQTILVKTDVIRALHGFNENLRALEDYEFVLRYAQNNFIGYVNEPLVKQFLSENSVNQNGRNKLLAEFYILEEFIEDYRRFNKVTAQFEIMRAEAERYKCMPILQEYVLARKNFYEQYAEWEKIYPICFSEQKLLYSKNRKYEGAKLIVALCEKLKLNVDMQQAYEIVEGIRKFSDQMGLKLYDKWEECNTKEQYGKLAAQLEENLQQQICTCPVCMNKVIYEPISDYYKKNRDRYGFPYSDQIFQLESTKKYFCPICGSTDRARLMIEFLSYIKDEDDSKLSVLQIAPDPVIERYLCARKDVLYESTDLYMDGVTFKADLQNMDMVQDNKYDIVLCVHVLEHVEDDMAAMKELYRILKPDGMCIVLVPLVVGLEKTDEQWGCSEKENWRRFGQNDHCRLYAKKDFIKRLEIVGFYVNELGKEWFGTNIYKEYGFDQYSILYVATKKEHSL